MIKPRIPETDHGIQGETTVAAYDEMLRNLRDKGWIETKAIIASGISSGHVLETGHGPGYLGLEWLKNTVGTTLTGLDISPDMQKLATKNALTYGLSDRVEYHLGNCAKLPFQEDSFDAVFTNGSLHEWEDPINAFNEIWRVLKPGGRYFISDLRRDLNILMRWFLWAGTRPKSIRAGLISSVNAAYTVNELREMIKGSDLKNGKVIKDMVGLSLVGNK